MERQKVLKLTIPVFTVFAMAVLSQVISHRLIKAITESGVHDHPLVTISLMGFFLFGFFAYWILVKLGIN